MTQYQDAVRPGNPHAAHNAISDLACICRAREAFHAIDWQESRARAGRRKMHSSKSNQES
jgi:hypothetical protein